MRFRVFAVLAMTFLIPKVSAAQQLAPADIWKQLVPQQRGSGPEHGGLDALRFELGWAKEKRFLGWRFAEPVEDIIDGRAILSMRDSFTLGTEVTLRAAHDRLATFQRDWFIAGRVPLTDDPRMASRQFGELGYRVREFPNPAMGSTQGFRGITQMKEWYLRTMLGPFVLDETRSLEGGNKGGTYTEVGLLFPWGNGVLGALYHYNHRYFRQAKGWTHWEFVFVSPMQYGTYPGTMEIVPYVRHQVPRASGFERQTVWGVDLRFRF